MWVVLTGWKEGLFKVSLTSLLHDKAGYSLSGAKGAVDALLDGREVRIPFEMKRDADHFLSEATQLGATGYLLDAT